MHLKMSCRQPKKKTAHSQRTNQYQATESKNNMPNTKADYLELGLGSLVSDSEGGRLAPLPSSEGWFVLLAPSAAWLSGIPRITSALRCSLPSNTHTYTHTHTYNTHH